MTTKPATDFIRAAVVAARTLSPREIRFGTDGITVIDMVGNAHEIKSEVSVPDNAALNEAAQSYDLRHYGGWRSAGNEIDVSGNGKFSYTEKDGVFSLRPKKPRAPCLEALITVDADKLAAVRSLYGKKGVDIFIAVDGDARAHDISLAMASELSLSGHAASLTLPPEDKYRNGRDETAAEQDGLPLFERAETEWSVRCGDRRSGFDNAVAAGQSRVVVVPDRHLASRFGYVTDEGVEARERPFVLIGVQIEKSAPVAKISLSKAAAALATTLELVENAPWTVYNDKKAARQKSRDPGPKTWHQTTEAVAEAFVERKAPRGYVSGKALFFHGPVAFSIYDGNPIAAFVDTPRGPILFTGREYVGSSTKSGVVSMARGDIEKASRDKGFTVANVDSLAEFLKLGDLELKQIASRFRNAKNEFDHPRSCKVDIKKLRTYLSERLETLEEGLDKANRQTRPTYVKAGHWRALSHLARTRDALAEALGKPLPHLGDADHFEAMHKRETAAADEHQVNLRDAKRATDAGPSLSAGM
jgi:hypothetical protein